METVEQMKERLLTAFEELSELEYTFIGQLVEMSIALDCDVKEVAKELMISWEMHDVGLDLVKYSGRGSNNANL